MRIKKNAVKSEKLIKMAFFCKKIWIYKLFYLILQRKFKIMGVDA